MDQDCKLSLLKIGDILEDGDDEEKQLQLVSVLIGKGKYQGGKRRKINYRTPNLMGEIS